MFFEVWEVLSYVYLDFSPVGSNLKSSCRVGFVQSVADDV